jgi:carbon monoxide dehydrogenase subunit G
MKITGEHTFASSREQVWAALEDPQMLANALPGVKKLEVTGPDEYAITVTVGVGSVKGTYDGTFRVTDKQAPDACAVRANATGGPGAVEAIAQMRMRDSDGGGALLSYEADANVTGPLAGVGQRLIGGAAKRTTREFLEALDRQLQAPAGAAPEETPEATPSKAAPPAERKAFVPAPAAPARRDPVVIVVSMLAGFLLALIGVGVGRWTARR